MSTSRRSVFSTTQCLYHQATLQSGTTPTHLWLREATFFLIHISSSCFFHMSFCLLFVFPRPACTCSASRRDSACMPFQGGFLSVLRYRSFVLHMLRQLACQRVHFIARLCSSFVRLSSIFLQVLHHPA
ncbi:unnamed protein product [Prorocentrum cordatum]|uniref:Transmembrane protein n=1 Tax=Prorocentrum cordatum TaxID=2364126 RepID=A0ABN9UB81_9DINO|nr:unnamed protein product [Polarella glacialis]